MAGIAEKTTRQRELESVRFDGEHTETAVLPSDDGQTLRTRWGEIQANFVDEPRKSVEEADKLVASAIQRIAEVFSERRTKLEDHWNRGDNVSTEDLRVSLQHYRAFFTRLLSI